MKKAFSKARQKGKKAAAAAAAEEEEEEEEEEERIRRLALNKVDAMAAAAVATALWQAPSLV